MKKHGMILFIGGVWDGTFRDIPSGSHRFTVPVPSLQPLTDPPAIRGSFETHVYRLEWLVAQRSTIPVMIYEKVDLFDALMLLVTAYGKEK